MGKKSSAVAKERRAAKRREEQQQERHRELLAGEYTEDRLARIRSAVREAIPGIGASMVVKAVDVLCLQASKACLSSNYQAIHGELRGELETQLCNSWRQRRARKSRVVAGAGRRH